MRINKYKKKSTYTINGNTSTIRDNNESGFLVLKNIDIFHECLSHTVRVIIQYMLYLDEKMKYKLCNTTEQSLKCVILVCLKT